jgi:hypothetical protein
MSSNALPSDGSIGSIHEGKIADCIFAGFIFISNHTITMTLYFSRAFLMPVSLPVQLPLHAEFKSMAQTDFQLGCWHFD